MAVQAGRLGAPVGPLGVRMAVLDSPLDRRTDHNYDSRRPRSTVRPLVDSLSANPPSDLGIPGHHHTGPLVRMMVPLADTPLVVETEHLARSASPPLVDIPLFLVADAALPVHTVARMAPLPLVDILLFLVADAALLVHTVAHMAPPPPLVDIPLFLLADAALPVVNTIALDARIVRPCL